MRGVHTRTRRGFTLIELALVLVLICLLLGLTVGTFSGTFSQALLDEQGGRMVSLIRALRAEAANTGRRFRLGFDEETGQPVVSTELAPLEEPGTFTPYEAWWVKLGALAEGVRVVRCELVGASDFSELSASTPGAGDDDRQDALATITFYPDGSCESAVIVLDNAGEEDDEPTWAVQVLVNGVDGTITLRDIAGDEEEGETEQFLPEQDDQDEPIE